MRLKLQETKQTKGNSAYIKKLQPKFSRYEPENGKKPAIRKPRDLSFGKDYIASVCEDYHYDGREIEEGIDLMNRSISTKEARKIAEFLLKAADYIDAKKRTVQYTAVNDNTGE